MNGFIRKMGSQFKKDIDNVKNNISKKRGKRKEAIPHNNLEFVVKSKKTGINFVFVLKQDRNTKGTAMILPMTVIRKKGFVTNQGEEVVVERKEIMKFKNYISESIIIYIVGMVDGKKQEEIYGGTAEQAASTYMKTHKKPECKIFSPSKVSGVYEATVGGKSKKKK